MECDACLRDASSAKDFLCITCARSSIYLLRLEVARLLLEKEDLGRQVDGIVQPPSDGDSAAKGAEIAQRAWKDEVANVMKADLKARIEQTSLHTEKMKAEMDQMRSDIAQRKAELTARREVLEMINATLPTRQQSVIQASSEIVEKGSTSFNNVNNRLSNTRAFLCRETAALLALKLKRRTKNGEIREQYTITGMLLPDLREINNMRCSDLSSVLGSVAHLLTLVAFYLGVRLPAEITTPHRDYPLPTINTPASSYLGLKVAFPGSGSINTANGSPLSSKHDIRSSHRPRPLFLGSDDRDEKVAQFAKREPSAFNFFVEGISLLAWDAAWLCRSQGFIHGTTTWEEICDVGRNLYQILLSPPQSPALNRILSDRDARRRSLRTQDRTQSSSSAPSSPGGATPNLGNQIQPIPGKLASASHLTTNPSSYLATPPNIDAVKSWKYSNYPSISDPLKKHLITEMNNAEWEVLQEQEWDDGGEAFDKTETVFVKPRNQSTSTAGTTSAIPTASTASPTQVQSRRESINTETENATNATDINDENTPRTTSVPKDEGGDVSSDVKDTESISSATTTATATKSKGTSGWTKVRGR